MTDPCNDGYEKTERIRIMGEAFRDDTTYNTWRDADKLYRTARRWKVAAGIMLLLLAVYFLVRYS